MKITIIGNCQSGALARVFRDYFSNVTVLRAIGVDVTPENSLSNAREALEAADVIVAQHIRDDYPLEFVRNGFLTTSFPGKVIFWPNHFFDGYAPEMAYIHDPEGRRHVLPGPLGDVHLRSLIYAYQNGFSRERATRFLNDPEFFIGNFSGVAERSLEELKRREAVCNVTISDHIESTFRHRRQFFTFNHPRTSVLYETATRLLSYLGVPRGPYRGDYIFEEDLSLVITPVPEPLYVENGMLFGNAPTYKGLALVERDGVLAPSDQAAYYSPSEMVDAFYDVYDRERERVMAFPLSLTYLMG